MQRSKVDYHTNSKSKKPNYREQFRSHKADAEYYDDQDQTHLAFNSYLNAHGAYLNIESKHADDNRNAADVCRKIAILYFNRKNHQQAAVYYSKAADYLLGVEDLNDYLWDLDYRKLVKNYVDLSHAHRQLKDFDSSDKALSNAIKQFLLIGAKTAEEQKAANAKDDYRTLHEMILNKTTRIGALNSDNFKKDIDKLHDKRDENTLISGFNTMMFTNTSLPNKHSNEINTNDKPTPQKPELIQTSIQQYTMPIVEKPQQSMQPKPSAGGIFGSYAQQQQPQQQTNHFLWNPQPQQHANHLFWNPQPQQQVNHPLWGQQQPRQDDTHDNDNQRVTGMDIC